MTTLTKVMAAELGPYKVGMGRGPWGTGVGGVTEGGCRHKVGAVEQGLGLATITGSRGYGTGLRTTPGSGQWGQPRTEHGQQIPQVLGGGA